MAPANIRVILQTSTYHTLVIIGAISGIRSINHLLYERLNWLKNSTNEL